MLYNKKKSIKLIKLIKSKNRKIRNWNQLSTLKIEELRILISIIKLRERSRTKWDSIKIMEILE